MKKILLIGGIIIAGVLYYTVVDAAPPCDAPANSIVAENCKTGTPRSQWDIPGYLEPGIEGFATNISYNKGELAVFKINTNASSYRIEIYRMGYYGGTGARMVEIISPAVPLPQVQPPCAVNATVGLVDCANWAPSASWLIPTTAVSGVYFAKLVRTDPEDGHSNHIFFIVRDDASNAPVVYQTADPTWQAYNNYGGWSLYFGPNPGDDRAAKVSYNRPFEMYNATLPAFRIGGGIFAGEYNIIRFLERNGYDVSYIAGVDSDRYGSLIKNHKIFISGGHDEYWSGAQRNNVELAADAGVNLAFLTANEVYWKTRYENNYRTLVTYKDAGEKLDPLPGVWTGYWRDLTGAAYDAGIPENNLTGTLFAVCCAQFDPFTVPATDGKMRFWRNTSIATMPPGAQASFATGLLGHEWDDDRDNGFRPAGLIHLSTTNVALEYKPELGKDGYILDPVDVTTLSLGDGLATHNLTLYRRQSGAFVFGAGTVNIAYALDDEGRDAVHGLVDSRMQQAFVNLFADMGVQPTTLQAGLVYASKSTDTRAPTIDIVSPTAFSALPQYTTVRISGSAVDIGGVVGAVEVSVDGGATWHPAIGRESWFYNWTPLTEGTFSLGVRAVDDSGNMTPTSWRSVTITPSLGHRILIKAAGTPAATLYPTMELYIKNQLVKTFVGVRGDYARKEFETYGYSQAQGIQLSDVSIRFANDLYQNVNSDRNLYIESISIDGVTYPTISPTTYSTGSHISTQNDVCVPGVADTNKLSCNGFFYYGVTDVPPASAPSCTVNVSSASGAVGETAMLTYSSLNSTHVLEHYGTQQAISGVLYYRIADVGSNTFTLTAVGASGLKSECSVTVQGTTAVPQGPSCSVTSNISSGLVGSSVVLTYSSENATHVLEHYGTQQSVSGKLYYALSNVGENLFSITAVGSGGAQNMCSVSVIGTNSSPLPEPTCSVTSNISSGPVGSSVILTYSSQNAAYVLEHYQTQQPTSGKLYYAVPGTGANTFTLTAVGSDGVRRNCSATVQGF